MGISLYYQNDTIVQARLAISERSGSGKVYLSDQQMVGLGVISIQDQCYVEDGVVKVRIPVTIKAAQTYEDGKMKVRVKVLDKDNTPLRVHLRVSGTQFGESESHLCPTTGVEFVFTEFNGGDIDVYERKYVSRESYQVIFP